MWENILKTVAPLLGTAIGGPFGGMAAKMITGALLGDDQATDDIEVAKLAITNATPDQLLLLKEADNSFKLSMEKLGIERKALNVKDRNSARDMQISTRSWAPGLIALCCMSGFFGILFALIFIQIPEQSIQPLNVMLGVLGTLVVGIANFYFGSSSGSKAKTEIMGQK